MFKSKKLLGIPLMSVVMIVGLLVILGTGGFTLAKFAYAEQGTASITILSDSLGAYTSEDCSTPFDSTVNISFGELYPSEKSKTVELFFKNQSKGQSKIFPQISVQNLPQGLHVSELNYGTVASSPEWTNLYTPASTAWNSSGYEGISTEAISATSTTFKLNVSDMSSSGVIKMDEEILSYGSIDVADIAHGGSDGKFHLNGLQRGLYGTTATSHVVYSHIYWGTANQIALDALDPGEVQPVSLVVTADDGVQGGDFTFDILIQATSEH